MKIQKGLVKDQGFQDTTCTYGTCDDGKIYYFIEDGTLENGNIIASTDLKEAIGHTVSHTSLGLINSNGDVIIPFKNRTIKLVSDKFLLVEKTDPTSKNVVEAMKDRADSNAANRLVTTAANNKDMMNAKIGNDGKFIFNNQFSEATIFDIDGNQIINDYYSYIAMDEDTIYFSKNIMDFPIVEYSMNAPLKMNPQVAEQINNQMKLDVTNTGVVQDSVENAFNETSQQIASASNVNEVQSDANISNDGSELNDVNTTQDNIEVSQEINSVNVEDSNVEEVASTDVSVNSSDSNDMNSNFDESEQVDDSEVSNDIVSTNVVDNEPIAKEVEGSSVFDDTSKSSIDFNEIKNDSISSSFVGDEVDRRSEQVDSVIENANNVMKQLIKQNKEQKDTIKNQDIKIESLEENNKILMDQCDDMTNQNEDLNRKIVRYETIIEKYAKKLNSLSDKVDNQAKTIASQQKRLDILEPQIAGRAQLGDTVEEAMEILNDAEIDNVYTKFVA